MSDITTPITDAATKHYWGSDIPCSGLRLTSPTVAQELERRLVITEAALEIARKALTTAKQYAHCNCPADEYGAVNYHSNCQRRLMPILKKALEETKTSVCTGKMGHCEHCQMIHGIGRAPDGTRTDP